MSDWKEFSSELARKTVDKIADLVYKYENKEITLEQAMLATDTIYDLISGLVSWDVADLAYNLKKELGHERENRI